MKERQRGFIAGIVANEMAVVGVADDVDWYKAEHFAKLRLRNEEWLDVVIWLICLAKCIVVCIDELSDDLRKELEVIEVMGRENNCLLIDFSVDQTKAKRRIYAKKFTNVIEWPIAPGSSKSDFIIEFIRQGEQHRAYRGGPSTLRSPLSCDSRPTIGS